MAFNLLVVDDSATMRTVIIKTLNVAEVPINELYQASDGKEALEILKGNWIDLVLADINMPVMNGVEMVDEMTKDDVLKTIPVIIVSTEGSAKNIERLKSKGVRAYVRKPFTPEKLKGVVQEVMGV